MSGATKRGIPRSLYFAMTLQFGVGGAVLPFVSMLLRDRGLDFGRISVIFFASSATLLIFPFLWGMLADRVIPINRLFSVLNILIIACLGLFSTCHSFLALLVTFTLFYACLNPSFSLVAALSFHHLDNPQEQFGRLRAWGSVGWILPSLPIFLWLIAFPQSRLDFTLFLGMGISLLMLAVSLWLPHTPSAAQKTHPESHSRGQYWPAIKRLLRNRDYVTLLVSFFMVAGSFFLLSFYSPPFLEDAGIPRAWIGPIQSLAVIIEIIIFPYLPRIIGRFNFASCLFLGAATLFLRHLSFAWFDNPWLLVLTSILAGFVIVLYHNTMSILVNVIAGPEIRATAQTMLVFIGSGVGPMFANWLAGRLAVKAGNNLHPVFLLAAILAGLAAILVAVRSKHLNRAGQRRAEIVPEIPGVIE